MRRWKWVSALTAACCALLVLASAPAGPARSAEAEHPVIAIIDMQQILRESVAMQEMQRQIEELRSTAQSEFRKKEDALRQRDQELARQRTVMSADDFAQKRQELEQQVAAAQREIQERRKSLEALFGQGMSQVRLALVDIVQKIASDRGADLVLAKTTVVLVRPDLEITDEALKQLNETLPSIDLPISND